MSLGAMISGLLKEGGLAPTGLSTGDSTMQLIFSGMLIQLPFSSGSVRMALEGFAIVSDASGSTGSRSASPFVLCGLRAYRHMSVKTLVKRAVGHALHAAHPLFAPMRHPVAVLTYHSVGGGAPGSQPASLFRAQIEWLAAHTAEFPVVPLRAAFTPASEASTNVLITFDDGYRDNAEVAGPILEEFGLQATFFVSSAFIDGDPHITTAFKNYCGLPNMTWEQVRELANRGHEIGLHGHRHANYGSLTRLDAESDLRCSYSLVRERTGLTPVSFAYAFGQPRHQRSDLAPVFQDLGIRYAFTSVHQRTSSASVASCADWRFTIPRLRVDPDDSVAIFVEKVRGLWDWVATVQRLELLSAA